MKFNTQIARAGTNLNGFTIEEEKLHEACKKIEVLPLRNYYRKGDIIGSVTNLKFKNGIVTADIEIYDKVYSKTNNISIHVD